jgi:endoglucanase Acf2
MFPLPLAFSTQAGGLDIGAPTVVGTPDAVYGIWDQLITAGLPAGSTAFPSAQLDQYSDWSARLLFSNGAQQLRATVAEGSPFSWLSLTGGNALTLTFRLGAPAQWGVINPNAAPGTLNGIGITTNGKAFGVFCAKGCSWSTAGSTATVTFSASSDAVHTLSLALLPQATQVALQYYARFAAFEIAETRVSWVVDRALSRVNTTYSYGLRQLTAAAGAGAAGNASLPAMLAGLIPHQWRNADASTTMYTAYAHSVVRGNMKIVELSAPAPCPSSMASADLAGCVAFSTSLVYPGILPYVPPVLNSSVSGYTVAAMAANVGIVDSEATHGTATDTYFHGKELQRIANVIPLAQAAGRPQTAAGLLSWLKAELQEYLSAVRPDGTPDPQKFFWYDKRWGAVVGFPDSFGSATELNDMHFHLGYWIHAAAQVAMNDPSWAAQSQWGAAVNLLVQTIAETRRNAAAGRDGYPAGARNPVPLTDTLPPFSFLRTFDIFMGHSWAAGHANFNDGNNQESSSEAINAWAGIIQWGAATGQQGLVDTGIYLYTHEVTSVLEYWFDIHRENLPAGYNFNYQSMVW